MTVSPPFSPAGIRAIESPANPLWKELRGALKRGTAFRESDWFVETTRLLEEAMRSPCEVVAVFALSDRINEFRQRFDGLPAETWIAVSSRAMASLPGFESSQGILALVRRPRFQPQDLFHERASLVVLDRLQDPGNAGTILRAAEAFGATGAIFLNGTASPDSGKVLRSSAGSLFRLPFVDAISSNDFLSRCTQAKLSIYAADPDADTSMEGIRWQMPRALVIGNEGAGICPEILRAATGFRIPTQRVESLNAAVSAGIALYAMTRTKASAPDTAAEAPR